LQVAGAVGGHRHTKDSHFVPRWGERSLSLAFAFSDFSFQHFSFFPVASPSRRLRSFLAPSIGTVPPAPDD
jgi:hypothetical protein